MTAHRIILMGESSESLATEFTTDWLFLSSPDPEKGELLTEFAEADTKKVSETESPDREEFSIESSGKGRKGTREDLHK